MSTRPVTTDSDQPVQPDRVFERYVWQNHEICNHCYRRCKTTTRFEYGSGHHQGEFHDRTPDGVLGRDVKTIDKHGAVRTHPPRTTCGGCGSVRLLAHYDTLSKRDAVDRVGRIADRLTEQGIPVDRGVMYRLVRRGKSRDTLEAYDREIFASAVKLGVQHGGQP